MCEERDKQVRVAVRTVTSAESCAYYGDLDLALLWWPEGALLVTEVLRAV